MVIGRCDRSNITLNYNLGYLYALLRKIDLSITHMNFAKNNCKDEISKKQIEEVPLI